VVLTASAIAPPSSHLGSSPETLSTHLYRHPFFFVQHSYPISDSRQTLNTRGKHIHSWSSILSRYVQSTLVCFRNNSPPHSACITSIYSRHPSPADWFHSNTTPSIFEHLFCSNIASVLCICTCSRRERLRLTGRSSFSSFPCSLFSDSHSALYAYTEYHTVVSHHCLWPIHDLLCDSICICMTVQHMFIRPHHWSAP
jgi:hypothetical protein